MWRLPFLTPLIALCQRGILFMELTILRRQVQTRIPFKRSLAPLIGALALFVLWEVITRLRIYPEFIIPPPRAVFDQFIEVLRDGRLWLHTSTTLGQMGLGLAFGVSFGIALGYLIAKNQLLEQALAPIIVALQSTPVVAYAPLLVIWFGTGPTSKIFICALIVFFPMLLNTVVGIRNVPSSLRDLMRSLRATRWQTFIQLEIPAALPVLLGGLKVSATLAVIGAVVGEFVSANAGLGYLVKLARDSYDTPLVVVAIIMLAFIARVMYGLVAMLERRFLAWQSRSRRDGMS
jgi:NitT/TauT family transport system permease protein